MTENGREDFFFLATGESTVRSVSALFPSFVFVVKLRLSQRLPVSLPFTRVVPISLSRGILPEKSQLLLGTCKLTVRKKVVAALRQVSLRYFFLFFTFTGKVEIFLHTSSETAVFF